MLHIKTTSLCSIMVAGLQGCWGVDTQLVPVPCRGYPVDPRAYGRNPYSNNPYDNPYYTHRNPYAQSRRGNNIYYIYPDQAFDPSMAAGPRGLPGPGRGYPARGGGLPGGVNPVGGLVNIATNLLLQLPFSR